MILLAPSILAADPVNLEAGVRRMEEAGCDWIHVDVMDAHFVPNLAFSPAVVKRLKQVTRLPLDVHLMMDHPETLLDAFLEAGADGITIHVEIGGAAPANPVSALLRKIRARGAKAGLALKPATPLSAALPFLPEADLVLCMTVEPGFGGQTLNETVLEKIEALRNTGYRGYIEADGGVREDNLKRLTDRGLTVAVMGTALFGSPNPAETVARLRNVGTGSLTCAAEPNERKSKP